MPRYTDPETKKSIFSETPLSDDEIGQAFGIAKEGRPEGISPTPAPIPPAITNPPPEGTITQAPPAWVPWVRSGIEMAGYGLGGGAGAAVGGPWGGRIGAGLGYATARRASNLINPLVRGMTGIQGDVLPPTESPLMHPGRERTLGEEAIEFGKDVGLGTIMKGAEEKVIAPILRKLPYYAKGTSPAALERATIAEREGIRAPASDITGNVSQAAVASSLQKLPQTGSLMAKQEGEIPLGQFSQWTERILGKLGGVVKPGKAGEVAKENIHKVGTFEIESQFGAIGGKVPKDLMGQSVQEGIPIAREGAKTAGGGFYDQAVRAAGDTPPTWERVPSAINAVKSSDRYKLMSEAGKKEVDNFIDLVTKRTAPETGEMEVMGVTVPRQISQGGGRGFVDEAALQGVEAEGGKVTNMLEAEGLRKSLAGKVYSRSETQMEAYSPMKRILSAFEDDMASSNPQAFNAFKIARENWATDVIGRFGEPGAKNILTKLEKASPEQVVDILKSKATTVKDLNQLMDVLPKDHVARMQGGIFTDLLEAGSTKSASGETVYNGPRIANAIKDFGNDKMKAILSPDQVRYLRDFASKKATEGDIFKIATGSPYQAFGRLKDAKPDQVELIKKNLNPDEFLQYRQGLLTHVFQKNSKTSPTTGEIVYNGPGLAKDLFGKAGIGEEKLKSLLRPEELSFLKEYARFGESMGSSWRLAGNPSGTAHQLYMLHLYGQAGKSAQKMMLGGALAGAGTAKESGGGTGAILGGGAAGAFIAPWMIARFITSNLGRKYLISGFPGMEKAITKAIPYGVIATRGILSRPDQEEEKQPVRGGALPFESRQAGGPVEPTGLDWIGNQLRKVFPLNVGVDAARKSKARTEGTIRIPSVWWPSDSPRP